MTDYVVAGFFWLALLLLGGVTLGVGYLTFLDWQDRRRRNRKL